jgi:dCMP deaminase
MVFSKVDSLLMACVHPVMHHHNCEDEIFETVTEETGTTTIITTRKVLKTKPEVLHAESNAIAKLARSSNSGIGADLFVTHSPCIECAKLVFQAGIKRVWFSTEYRDSAGVDFLVNSGVEVNKINA